MKKTNKVYEFTDKVINYLNKEFIDRFAKMKSLVSFDELNVMQSVNNLYRDLYALIKKMFLQIAIRAYKDAVIKSSLTPNEAWVNEFFLRYDPVTGYVFEHEIERKAARFAEALIGCLDKTKEVDTALRYMSSMMSQYADEITDAARKKAFEDDGVEKLRWVTVLDDKVCKICREREGEIYDISKYPPPPHIGCRCYPVPYFGDE